MHGTSASVEQLCDGLKLKGVHAQVLILPPAAYLAAVVNRVRGKAVDVGAQHIHCAAAGAFTGETAAEMVKDLGATHVLVGHSERRQLFGETDSGCAERVAAALRAGLIPVLCVGETAAERDEGDAQRVVIKQLNAVLDLVGIRALQNAVVAYEPVWAIGTGRTATPDDAQIMHAAIRAHIAQRDLAISDAIRILYGGSVKADNAAALFAQPDIDGGLVGGASLNTGQFLEICRAA